MNCPKCGKEMTSGTIKGRSGVIWTPDPNKLLPWPGKNDVLLCRPYEAGEEAPKAWICKDCKTVVLEYN